MTKTNHFKTGLINLGIVVALCLLAWGLWSVGGNNINNYCETASTYEQTKIDYILWCQK